VCASGWVDRCGRKRAKEVTALYSRSLFAVSGEYNITNHHKPSDYHTTTAKCNNHLSCFISHQSVCNSLITLLIHRPPYKQPRSTKQHTLKASVRSENGVIYWVMMLRPAALHKLHIWYPETWLHPVEHWVISPPGRCLSSIHLVSFLNWFHPSISQSYTPALLHLQHYPLKTREWTADPSLRRSLNPGRKRGSWLISQAWNVMWH